MLVRQPLGDLVDHHRKRDEHAQPAPSTVRAGIVRLDGHRRQGSIACRSVPTHGIAALTGRRSGQRRLSRWSRRRCLDSDRRGPRTGARAGGVLGRREDRTAAERTDDEHEQHRPRQPAEGNGHRDRRGHCRETRVQSMGVASHVHPRAGGHPARISSERPLRQRQETRAEANQPGLDSQGPPRDAAPADPRRHESDGVVGGSAAPRGRELA